MPYHLGPYLPTWTFYADVAADLDHHFVKYVVGARAGAAAAGTRARGRGTERSRRWADEWAQAYQYYEGPRLAEDGGGAEKPLFRNAAAYVVSLPLLEDADAARVLLSAAKSNDFAL